MVCRARQDASSCNHQQRRQRCTTKDGFTIVPTEGHKVGCSGKPAGNENLPHNALSGANKRSVNLRVIFAPFHTPECFPTKSTQLTEPVLVTLGSNFYRVALAPDDSNIENRRTFRIYIPRGTEGGEVYKDEGKAGAVGRRVLHELIRYSIEWVVSTPAALPTPDALATLNACHA